MVVTCLEIIVHPDYASSNPAESDKGKSPLAAGSQLILPEELFPDVFGYLQAPSLLAAGSACRSWKALSRKEAYWHRLCKAKWGISPDQLATPRQRTPRRRRARSEDGALQEPKSPIEIYQRGHASYRKMRRRVLDDQRMLAARAALKTARVPMEVLDRMVSRQGRSRAWSFG